MQAWFGPQFESIKTFWDIFIKVLCLGVCLIIHILTLTISATLKYLQLWACNTARAVHLYKYFDETFDDLAYSRSVRTRPRCSSLENGLKRERPRAFELRRCCSVQWGRYGLREQHKVLPKYIVVSTQYVSYNCLMYEVTVDRVFKLLSSRSKEHFLLKGAVCASSDMWRRNATCNFMNLGLGNKV